MTNWIKNLGLLLLAGGFVASCSNDDWKDDVNALKKPVPTGIVFVDAAPVTAVKGTQFQLRFRVNPTGVTITKNDLELDLRNSDTYFRFDKSGSPLAMNSSRASYVTPSDYYEVVSVEPDTNGSGEKLDGQWIATIGTRGEGNFRNVADLSLIVNYTDAAGVVRKVSSSALPVEIVPTVDEGVVFGYSKVQAIRTKAEAVNPYILFVDIQAYRNDEGEEWYYNRQYITEVDAAINDGELTADASALYEKYYISFTPDTEKAIWQNLEAGDVKTAVSDVEVELIDFGGTKKTLELPVLYSQCTIFVECEIPRDEINANIDNAFYSHDISEELSQYGLTADFSSCLTRRNFFGMSEGNMSDYLIIDEVEISGDNNEFKPVISMWVMDEVPSGFEITKEEAAKFDFSLTSFPQDKGSADAIVLSDWDIRITIKAID